MKKQTNTRRSREERRTHLRLSAALRFVLTLFLLFFFLLFAPLETATDFFVAVVCFLLAGMMFALRQNAVWRGMGKKKSRSCYTDRRSKTSSLAPNGRTHAHVHTHTRQTRSSDVASGPQTSMLTPVEGVRHAA